MTKRCFTIPARPLNNAGCIAPAIGGPFDHPQSQEVNENDSVTFTVLATGTDLSYQWYKNGIAISNANSSSYTIPYVSAADQGSYYVIVSNGCGTIASSPANLTMIQAPASQEPQITKQPTPLALSPTQDALFDVIVTGTGPFTYQWYKDDVLIVGATSSVLSVPYVDEEDEGSYRVLISNAYGNILSDAALLVIETPAGVPPGNVEDAGIYDGDTALL